MTLGQKIYRLRTKRNLSRHKLARQIYASEQSVKAWEKLNQQPRLDTAVRLARAFNISLEEFLEGVDF